MNRSKKRHELLLIITAFIWGTAFVAQSTGGQTVGPYTFNCIRSFIGALALIPAIAILDRMGLTNRLPVTASDKKILTIGGISCGTILFIASSLQQLGIYYGSSTGKAGFLTACYILLVPVIELFFKKKCGLNIWISVAITLIGLYLLCMQETLALQFSDLLLILCALAFALHIIMIGHFTPMVDGVRMSCIQFFVSTCLSTIPMYVVDMNHSISGILTWASALTSFQSWISILYAGVMSCGIAYTLQIIGQQSVDPTIASLLMSLESVFAVLAGWILLGETMSFRELLGCAFIFAAVIFAQIPVKGQMDHL